MGIGRSHSFDGWLNWGGRKGRCGGKVNGGLEDETCTETED